MTAIFKLSNLSPNPSIPPFTTKYFIVKGGKRIFNHETNGLYSYDKMDYDNCCSDEDIPSEEETYTDDQKYSNYNHIIDVIKHIKTGQRITEDWMEEEIAWIRTIRDFYPDMSRLNPEIVDKRWRAMAEECELVLSELIWEINETRKFPIALCLRLHENIKKMFDFQLTDDEIEMLMSRMAV